MILGVLLTAILSSVSFAEVPKTCSDLGSITCSEGVRDDGTGVSSVADANAFAANELARIKPQAFEKFKIALRDDVDFRKSAIKALRLDTNAYWCKKNSRHRMCLDVVASRLANLFIITETDPEHRKLDELSLHPVDAELAVQLVQENAYKEVANEFGQNNFKVSDAEEDKVETTFENVKAAMKRQVANLPISDEVVRANMLSKIDATKFGGIKCGPAVNYSGGLFQALFPNAVYHIGGKVNICPAYLRYSNSEFDLSALLAHEFVHSIDPCRIGNSTNDVPKLPNPKSDVEIANKYIRPEFLSCLRSESSVGATSFRKPGPYHEDTARFCVDDQINESVADWFAAEVVAEFAESKLKETDKSKALSPTQVVAGIQNVYRPLCSKELNVDNPTAEHPATKKRLNSIFLVHPKIRTLLGCGDTSLPGKRYCDIQNPAALATQTEQSKLNPAVKNEVKQ